MPPAKTRTNSLGFAKTDCHTCTANRRQCDRKRPRCSSCCGMDTICGGYPMQLTWPKSKPIRPKTAIFSEQRDDPFHLEPLSLQASIHVKDRISRARPRKPRTFRFIIGPASDRKQASTRSFEAIKNSVHPGQNEVQPLTHQSNTTMDRSVYQPLPNSLLNRTAYDDLNVVSPCLNNEQSNVLNPGRFEMISPIEFSGSFQWKWASTGTIDTENPDIADELNKYCAPVISPLAIENAAREHRAPIPMSKHQQNSSAALWSPVLHENLVGKFEILLNMYNQDFCVMPLSGDIASNPFRCRSKTYHGSKSLLHAVLAISCYHAGRQTGKDDYPLVNVVNHQNTALKLYHDELDACTGSQAIKLLDTTMVLFLINAAQSAFGNWATRISGAMKLLRLSGEAKIWIHNRRVQAQVVMLLWWDATIALLSRQGCLISYSYFEALLGLEDVRYWTFFDLIGCPRELVVPLMQLASLAKEKERASSLSSAKFDMTVVDEIQASIINWNNPGLEIVDDMSEEQMQQQRDRWNCTEAWRYGLLIYITRVFQWNRNMNPPSALVIYARLILERVHSCRHTAIVQKQAFLPLFFAGCETKDQFSRQSIRDYCQYWSKVCGYDLFRTASSLLEDLWREQDESPSNGVWWGSVIDKKQQSYSDAAPMQFCFG